MRKLVLFTIGFGTSTFLGAYFALPAPLLLIIWAGLLMICVLLMLKWKVLRVLPVIALGLVVGTLWFHGFELYILADARNSDGQILDTSITASDFSYETDYGAAVDGVIHVAGREYRVRAYLKDVEDLVPGDVVSGSFRFRVTTTGGAENPTHHRGRGVFLLLYQQGEAKVQKYEDITYKSLFPIWRRSLLERIDEIFPADAAGFARALLLGDRSGIDYETDTAFRLSGISHIIAVSGLHVSMLFGLLYTLAGRRRFLTALIGIPGVLLFAAVAGFTPSITRAAIMQCLMLIALAANREYDPPTALAFAVLSMLLVNPLTITSVSFQLSVGCLIGIFLFSDKIAAWLRDEKRLGPSKGKGIVPGLKRWFISSVSITLSATVMTAPLCAWYFGSVSLVGVLTNLLTLWVISFIFGGVILSLILGAAGSFVAWAIAWPIRFVIGTSKLLAAFPLASVYTRSPYIVIWVAGCYVLLAVCMMSRKKNIPALCCCAAISLCFCLGCSWAEPLLDECRVTVLDVGQGQSILLQSEGKTFLVDCGGSMDDDAADAAAETLLSQGITRLDGLILTHYDADHAGGAEYLLTRMDTDLLLLPEIADPEGVGDCLANKTDGTVQYVDTLSVIAFGDAKITIIPPISYDLGNESSLCILFQTESCDILITGDRGSVGERLLLEQLDLPEVELLIVGHHGSKYSTTDHLLEVIRPQTAIISVGEDNFYGHPSAEVLQRLEEFGCPVYRTDLQGTIVYRR